MLTRALGGYALIHIASFLLSFIAVVQLGARLEGEVYASYSMLFALAALQSVVVGAGQPTAFLKYPFLAGRLESYRFQFVAGPIIAVVAAALSYWETRAVELAITFALLPLAMSAQAMAMGYSRGRESIGVYGVSIVGQRVVQCGLLIGSGQISLQWALSILLLSHLPCLVVLIYAFRRSASSQEKTPDGMLQLRNSMLNANLIWFAIPFVERFFVGHLAPLSSARYAYSADLASKVTGAVLIIHKVLIMPRVLKVPEALLGRTVKFSVMGTVLLVAAIVGLASAITAVFGSQIYDLAPLYSYPIFLACSGVVLLQAMLYLANSVSVRRSLYRQVARQAGSIAGPYLVLMPAAILVWGAIAAPVLFVVISVVYLVCLYLIGRN